MHFLLSAVLLATLSVEPAASFANTARQIPALCPADPKLAALVAASPLIMIGKMEVPKQRLVAEAQKPSPEYLDIPIRIDGTVKGDGAGSETIRFYPVDASYKPSNELVLRLAGTPAILFLTRVNEGPVGLYFAGNSPDALKSATEQTIGAARAETARQQEILRAWRMDTRLPRFGEVRALIARLGHVRGKEQQRVFDQLESLGTEAVPAIIAQMDDRRALATRAISLVNHAPDAFEGMRHYGPEQVVDGLNAVLNQITDASFGPISNGGSDRQRDAAVAGWRVYASDLTCKKPA